ncbi:MAG: 23S rRNA (pseudouridine(1915)-N(3))-methyltransferase RlmH [Methylococcaceae bacterium]|nr:23S rRNA (pseudouridine(1915)-N(3))-methyltransferase RlmH [Methylococcaceae bacterium]
MQIQLLCVGNRMPGWVSEGYEEYAKRLPRECELRLREIPPGQRGKNADIARAIEDEGRKMLAAVPPADRVVALDLSGKEWSTEELADSLARWLGEGRNLCLLVGGPDGLAPACLARADERWKLSALTLPHPLVRVVLAEQIYRAWSLLHKHPYHR